MDFFQSMCDSLSKIAGKELLNYLNLWILCNSLFIVFSVLSYSIFLWFRHGCLHRRPRERSERKRVTSTETYGLIGRGMNAQVSFYQAVSPGPTRSLSLN